MSGTAIPVKVTRYKCPFCSKSRSSRKAAQTHVDSCWMDRVNHACKTCDNFRPIEPEQAEHCAAGIDITDGLQSQCPAWCLDRWLAPTPRSS
jgi:hypothetical protein